MTEQYPLRKRIKNFLQGMASILVICPSEKSASAYKYPYKTDEEALRSDWEKIGNDFKKVL